IRALFRYGEQPNFPPRYNIAPTQPIPIVRLVDGMRSFALMRWGLLPSWVGEPKTFPLIRNRLLPTSANNFIYITGLLFLRATATYCDIFPNVSKGRQLIPTAPCDMTATWRDQKLLVGFDF